MSGIRICELLPLLAKQADKYSLIRGMTHGLYAHETASYTVQTGRIAGGHDVYPSVGAVVSLFKGYNAGYKGLIPPYIVLTEPQGRFSEAGFLGSRYKPFATGGDPAQARFAVEGVVAQGITDQRQQERREYLHQLDTLGNAMQGDPQIVAASDEAEEQAYELILGDAGKVFDLSQEKDDLRDRYGRNTFGQSCLVGAPAGGARRSLHHHQLPGRLGHAQAEFPDHAPQAAGDGQGPGDAARRISPSAACWTAPSSGGTANSAGRRRWIGKPRGTAGRNHWGDVFSARGGGRRFQRRPRGGRLRRAAAKRSRTGRSIRWT